VRLACRTTWPGAVRLLPGLLYDARALDIHRLLSPLRFESVERDRPALISQVITAGRSAKTKPAPPPGAAVYDIGHPPLRAVNFALGRRNAQKNATTNAASSSRSRACLIVAEAPPRPAALASPPAPRSPPPTSPIARCKIA